MLQLNFKKLSSLIILSAFTLSAFTSNSVNAGKTSSRIFVDPHHPRAGEIIVVEGHCKHFKNEHARVSLFDGHFKTHDSRVRLDSGGRFEKRIKIPDNFRRKRADIRIVCPSGHILKKSIQVKVKQVVKRKRVIKRKKDVDRKVIIDRKITPQVKKKTVTPKKHTPNVIEDVPKKGATSPTVIPRGAVATGEGGTDMDWLQITSGILTLVGLLGFAATRKRAESD